VESVRVRRDFPRPVRTVEHAWIELSDGCRLAVRIWPREDAETCSRTKTSSSRTSMRTCERLAR
jgi:hypothetical protein